MGQCHFHPADTFHSLQAASQFKQAYSSLCTMSHSYFQFIGLITVASVLTTVCTTIGIKSSFLKTFLDYRLQHASDYKTDLKAG